MDSSASAQLYDQALALHKRGLLADAESRYRQVLAIDPAQARALHMLGVVLDQQDRSVEALQCLTRAVGLQPNVAEFHYNLARVLRRLGHLDEAIGYYRRAIELRAGFYEAQKNLGNALTAAGRLEEAEASFRAAAASRLDSSEAHLNLGRALLRNRKAAEAIASCERAIAIQPGNVAAYSDLGLALREVGQIDAAISRMRQGLALDPSNVPLNSNLGGALRDIAQLDAAITAFRIANAKQTDSRAGGNLLYSLLFHPDYDLGALYTEHRRWNDIYARPLLPAAPDYANSRDPDRRLRIGLVSPQFRDVWFILPLLEHLDRSRFKVVCYDNIGSRSVPSVLRHYADQWTMTATLSDDDMAQQIREDQIDILVDLALHTDGNRLLVFARKPAPVQVTWLGYPGTSGMDAMDYRISDPYLDPPDADIDAGVSNSLHRYAGGGLGRGLAEFVEEAPNAIATGPLPSPPPGYRGREKRGDRDQFYAEKTIRLPHCFWCYAPLGDEPAVNDLPGDRNGFITFGCLNNFVKVNDPTIKLWSRVLNAVPESRMKLLGPAGSARDRVIATFAAEGIAASRIDFINQQSHAGYLRTFSDFDISLDPFPCTGHTTTIESLWMGVPVVSLVGQTPFSRASLSILSNVGLAALVSYDDDRYVETTVALANDRQHLGVLRSTLRRRIEQSPVMASPRFSADMQAIFRTIWQNWCASFLQDG